MQPQRRKSEYRNIDLRRILVARRDSKSHEVTIPSFIDMS